MLDTESWLSWQLAERRSSFLPSLASFHVSSGVAAARQSFKLDKIKNIRTFGNCSSPELEKEVATDKRWTAKLLLPFLLLMVCLAIKVNLLRVDSVR